MRSFLFFLFVLLLCGGAAFLLLLFQAAKSPSPSSLLVRGVRRTDRLCTHLGMLLVPSPHVHRRQLIRETWAHPFHLNPLGLSVAFVTDGEADLEAEIFGDILSAESSMLRSAREACGHRKGGAKFLVIVEEEIFVNIFALADMLHELRKMPLPLQRRHAIWCHVREGGTVLTVDSSDASWHLSSDVIPTSSSHCDPSAMVVGVGAADTLLMLAEHEENMTRTVEELAKEAGVELVQMEGRYDHRRHAMDEGRLLSGQTIFARVEDEARMEALWNSLLVSQKKETEM